MDCNIKYDVEVVAYKDGWRFFFKVGKVADEKWGMGRTEKAYPERESRLVYEYWERQIMYA